MIEHKLIELYLKSRKYKSILLRIFMFYITFIRMHRPPTGYSFKPSIIPIFNSKKISIFNVQVN